MSSPTRQHVYDPRAGGLWVPGRFIEMRCDGGAGNCRNSPQRAPRLMVPPRLPRSPLLESWMPLDPAMPPIRRFTSLHFCELHKGECTAERLLAEPNCKAMIENAAKRRWPHGVLPDFDNAQLEWLLTTTPEYREFLGAIERNLLRDQAGVTLL